jgi:hypothetical protein
VFETTARDFGVVDEGAVLSHTYSFRNTGKGQLDITTRSSCGCTAALLSEKSIPPGGKGKIFVEFNTAGKHKGKNEVQIIVRSNDPGRKISTLKILATIRGRIAAIPDKVFLGEVGANSVVRREVLLRDAGDGVSKVIGVTVPEGVQAKILPARMDSTKSRIIPIQLTIRSGSLPGEISKYAVIRTNSGKQPEIPVQIYGTVASRIKVYPARIFFGDVAANATIRREATITPAEGMKIDPEKISAGDPRFITRITPLDGKSYRMSVTLTASGPEATLNDSIKLYLAGNSAPEIEIPIYARVVSKR